MTTTTDPLLYQPFWTDPDRAVVVAVDGSDHNHQAVRWAVDEAVATRRPLNLLTVASEYGGVRETDGLLTRETDDYRAMLRTLAEKIQHDHPYLTLRRHVEVGAPVPTLLKACADQNLMVMGRRGLGAFGRILVGSTSIGVAGRAAVPVVIVPDEWDRAEHESGAVVVGVDVEDLHQQALHYAFSEADRRRVELVVAYAPHLHNAMIWDPALYADLHDQWLSEGRDALDQVLTTLKAAFPAVRVRTEVRLVHPGDLVLQLEPDAQLLVLGRKREGHFGFAFGSVTRGVLHYATTPVAVVPAYR